MGYGAGEGRKNEGSTGAGAEMCRVYQAGKAPKSEQGIGQYGKDTFATKGFLERRETIEFRVF